MNVEIRLCDDVSLKFELSSIRYQLKNNILAERTRKSLILNSDIITLNITILPTKYTKYIEVYTVEGEKVVINKELPTTLNGDFKFVIKKKTIDIKKTLFFNSAYNPKTVIEDEIQLENLKIARNSVIKARNLKKAMTITQNILHFGSELQFDMHNSKEINIDIQELIILEQLLSKNLLINSKYLVLEITKINSDIFLNSNKEYILNLLNSVSEKMSVFIYTNLSVKEKEKFEKYEQVATAVLYNDIELMQAYIEDKTKTLKIDTGKINDHQFEYVLNDLSKRNVIVEYNCGITITVNNFEQLVHAIIENLSECLSYSRYLNIQTNFELTVEQQNLITCFGCQNILLNSNLDFQTKDLSDKLNLVLTNSYPKYTNDSKSLIANYLDKCENKQTVVLVADVVNPTTSIIDGCLVVKMNPKYLALVINAYKNVEVIGYNNNLVDVLYGVKSTINYFMAGISTLEEKKLDAFSREMWKIIGMPNIEYKFSNKNDFDTFREKVNKKQISFKYSVLDDKQEYRGFNYFELNGQQQPIVIRQKCKEVKILKDAVYIIAYHNKQLINTIDAILGDKVFQLTNNALLHLPANTILDCKGKEISIYCTGNEYSSNEFKKYQNEWIVNSSILGEYVENPNFTLGDFYENYAGIYISPEQSGQMFVTNISKTNKDRLNELYKELLDSDKLIYMIVDENSKVTNIITTYNVISNLKLSVLATQDEVYQKIKQNRLWKYVEVII